MVFLILYCVLITVASLVGGWIPNRVQLSHVRIQLVISFVAGVMLGVAVLHMLPHSISVLPNFQWTLGCMLFGILFMFFMNRFFHFHQHDFSVGKAGKAESGHLHQADVDCDHEHHHHRKDTSWIGLSFGLAIHTMIDGIALAAAVKSETMTGFSLAGLSIFLAIVLHKPLDAISIASLMKAKGISETRRTIANVAFSLMCPLGAMLFFIGLMSAHEWQDWVLGLALAFSAGVFLCISLGDLLPEVHFHSHDRWKLSAALLFGILVAAAVEMLPGHQHGPVEKTNIEKQDDLQDGKQGNKEDGNQLGKKG